MEYRLQGRTFFDIGKALGVTPGRAHQLVDEALSETVAIPAEELRTLELGRLEYLLTAFFPRALRGDDRAVNSVLKIMDRQIKLLGVDKLPPLGTPHNSEKTHSVELVFIDAKRSVP